MCSIWLSFLWTDLSKQYATWPQFHSDNFNWKEIKKLLEMCCHLNVIKFAFIKIQLNTIYTCTDIEDNLKNSLHVLLMKWYNQKKNFISQALNSYVLARQNVSHLKQLNVWVLLKIIILNFNYFLRFTYPTYCFCTNVSVKIGIT